jgi:hypothetical protein
MPQIIRPASVKVVQRDGELEITLNINITIDGAVTATVDNDKTVTIQQEKQQVQQIQMPEDRVQQFIPDFSSGKKLNFGKKE